MSGLNIMNFIIYLMFLSVSISKTDAVENEKPAQISQIIEIMMEVENILHKNGYNNLSFVSLDYNKLDAQKICSELVYTRRQSMTKEKLNMKKCNFFSWPNVDSETPSDIVVRSIENIKKSRIRSNEKSSKVFLMSTFNESHFDIYLNEITNAKILTRALVIMFPPTAKEKLLFNQKVDRLRQNSMFYLINAFTKNQSEFGWNYIITLPDLDKAIINEIKFDSNQLFKEEFNLQGAHLVSISLSWNPYFMLHECNAKGTSCKSIGYLKNLMDGLGELLNFTWESHQEVHNNWGLVQNDWGTWDGVVGHVFNSTYQLSISAWVWNLERNEMFDFVPLLPEKMVLASMSDPSKYLGGDNWLLARPFRKDAWIMIFLVATIMIVVMKVLSWKKESGSLSKKPMEITYISFSFFFLIVLSYYEGALIMFFSSDTNLPFDDIKDVMNLYPHRKLMMRKAYDVFYLHHVQSGDKDYEQFWNRVKRNPEETVFTSVEEVFRKFPDGGVVIHESEPAIRTYLDSCGGKRKEHFDAFVKGNAEYRNLIVTKGSPLGPILRYGTRLLLERGATPSFKSSWNMNHTDCHALRNRPEPSMSMQLRHFAYLFFSLLISFLMCLIIFSGEILENYLEISWTKFFPFLKPKTRVIEDQFEYEPNIEPTSKKFRNPFLVSLYVLEAVGLNYHGKYVDRK